MKFFIAGIMQGSKTDVSLHGETGRRVFLTHNQMCGSEIDVLVAFVPEASMGTAIEIWEAWKNGALVLTISPMATNWAVKFLSDAVYPDLDSFQAALDSGEIARFIAEATPRSVKRSLDHFDKLINAK